MSDEKDQIRNKLSMDAKKFWDSLDEQTKNQFASDVKQGALLKQVVGNIEDMK